MADPMLLLLQRSYLTGWLVAAPIGPVNLEIARRGLGRGIGHGFMVGLGATCLDATYLLVFTAGLGVMLQDSEILRRVLFFVGGGLLLWLGIMALRETRPLWRGKNPFAATPRGKWGEFAQSLPGHWLLGFLMCATNPMTLAFWASLSMQFVDLPMQQRLLASGLVWLGAFSWVTTLTLILAFARKWVGPKLFAVMNALGGLCMAGFGVWFWIRAIL